MGQRNVRSRTGAAALALVLSLALVAGTPLDAARAYAAEPLPAATAESEGASQPDTNANGAGESAKDPAGDGGSSSGQLSEDVPLDAPAGAPQDGSQAPAGADAAPSAPIDQSPASGQATAAVPLVPEAPKAVVGEVVQDGLVYRILDDGESVALVGWRGASLAGDVAVPYLVMSGEDAYAVTVIGDPDIDYTAADGSASGVLAGSGATSLSLPASVETVADGALSGCPLLESVFASPQNQKYASSDGMLFSKDLSALLFVPEGKRGTARIPDETSSAPASAFSSVSGLSAVHAGEGSAAFSAREGVLYSKDGASLLYFPAAAGNAVVLPAETESIGEGAFAQAEGLASIVALGYVRDIHETAFAEAAKRDAQVALPAGENYDTRKVVWEAAGFQSFVEPAAPGDAVGPTDPEGQPASGFVFTLLDDYTLAVSWVGESDPEADLVIPATAKLNDVEYRVSAIAPAGFQGRQSLSSVQIRAPITVIGDDAFTGCTGLASVELSEGVSAIGAGAFSGTAVQRVVIPASVTSVGSRAFADCPDLSRIVTFSNAPSVDADAIAGCTGVAIYAPYDEAGEYPWNPGLVASGNHILPYGISLASDPLALEVGETADLFEGGVCEVPDGCELTYSYAATPISVEAGQVTGKKIGVSEVTAVLSLDGIELARIMRVVEVVAGKPTPYIFDADGTYTFRFDSLGGTSVPDQKIYMTGIASGGPTSSSHYNMTPNITKPQDPSKPGYTFVGWSIRSHPEELYNFGAGSAEFDSGDFVSGIVTFYAKWKRVVPQGATTGTIGDGVTWYITSTNELIITPTNGISGTLPASYAESYIPWANNSTIKVATIDSGVKANESLGYLFYGNSALTEIKGLDSLITSGVKKVAHMLHGCSSLSFLDVSKWDTSSISDMTCLFYGCSSLSFLDVSKWDTSNLFVAYSLFANCSRLSSIDVSGWNTPKLTQTTWMFSGCTSLTSLDFSSWDTSKVSAMGRMFNDCTNLTSLDLLGFDTSVVTINEGMFANCSSLSSLDLSTWSLPVNTNMDELFADCSKLTFLDISSLDTSKLPGSAVGVFRNCPSLSEVKVGSNYTLKVLSKPMMNGYTGNWINSSGKSFAYNAIPSGVADTYRAQTSYNIAFNGNGSTGGSMAVQTVPHGMSVNLTSNGFTKTGHTFAGWAESATGAVKYANGASVKDLTSTPNGTVTLYAKWTPNPYSIIFNGNGNTGGSMSNQSMTYGTAKNLTSNGFTKTGHTFAGWAESATGAVKYANGASVKDLTSTPNG
uniref:leucine-rich repeat protein n=1 Tax=Enteroscipio rubneri TaxID=2070686 RepID=UPI00101AD212